MLNYTRAFLFIALTFSLNTFAQKTATPPLTKERAPQTSARENKRLEIVSFESKLIGQTLPYMVVLPIDYDKLTAQSTRYPVLFLLHGLTGDYTNWTSRTKLPHHAAQYSMIIVTPEGKNGWYTDSTTVPADKYETYVIEELLPDVQRRYRTVESREGRGIAGLSMGGYGALKFGVKYPQTFVFVASMSGALSAASWTESDLRGFESIWRTLAPVFGPQDNPMRKANDVHGLYRDLPAERIRELPFVYLDCGTEDPLFQSSRSFAEILLARKIPHEYRQLPGGHNWVYWDAQVQEVLKIAAQKLGGPAKIPKSGPR